MADKIHYFISNISIPHLNMLFILALVLFGGTMGGRMFQKMKIPQVVGYIIIGIFLGQSGLHIIDAEMVKTLQPFNYFALGIIGFLIGGELKKDVIARYGKQFIIILLFEGITAFVFVAVLVGFIGSLMLGDPHLGWGLGVMFGAISSATAPAATTDVLWELKAKGPLTTMVFGIVALDDALALLLFAIASNLATHILGLADANVLWAFIHPLYEIGGAVVVGGVSGLILIAILRHYDQRDRLLVFLLGMVLFVLGISIAMNVSMILAAMVLGIVVVNGVPNISRQAFDLISEFAPPIFVMFFVLIGAKLNLAGMNTALLVMACLYLIGRTSGKMLGAFVGSALSGANASVRKYLPLCLFSQAGVAIGLSIVASNLFPDNVGDMIVIVITATTFIVQIIGPPCVKIAAERANEAGKNITEEDLMKGTKVEEVADPSYPSIKENVPLNTILSVFSQNPYTQYPVINEAGEITGVINIESIKNTLLLTDTGDLLLGEDIKEPYNFSIPLGSTLFEAKRYMDQRHLGFIPVVNGQGVVHGCFDRRMYQKFVSTKLLEFHKDDGV